ncbi:NAD(P)H-binding protein [Streptomyces sp. NPDC086091]|uniref:NAD(P)H-binding protein n=1 Tax=Streptomyces sp. NPDC086091 TaxID=3365751 RepID=UPI00382CB102
MIVVSAASGAFGLRVIDRLLAGGREGRVVAAVRTPDKVAHLAARGVEVRHGDYDRPDTLATAFAGAERLLLISSPELDPERRVRQHRAAVDAAHVAGVGVVVYTSFLGADTEPGGLTAAHHATERAVRDSGVAHTLLRHPFYSEAFLHPGLQSAVDSGELLDGTGGRALNTASRDDLAEAAARVLTEDHHTGRAYDFTGALWTYTALADSLTRATGTQVVARPRAERLPGAQGWLEDQIRAGALERRTDDLDTVLGHPATSLDEAVAGLFGGVRADRG